MAAQHKRPGRTAKRERQQRVKARRKKYLVIELWPVVRDHRPGKTVIAAEWRERAI